MKKIQIILFPALALVLLSSPAFASSDLYVSSTGNVGIGNTSPGALLDLGLSGTTTGTMRFEGGSSGYVQIQPSAAAGSWTMTLPPNAGTSGYFLQTDGSGNTSWAATSGGGGGMTLLATVNASAASSVTFGSSYLTSTYNKYVIEYDGTYTSIASFLGLQISTNNCSTMLDGDHYAQSACGSGGSCGTGANDTQFDITAQLSNASTDISGGTIKFNNPSSAVEQSFTWEASGQNTGDDSWFLTGGGIQEFAAESFNCVAIVSITGGTITGNFHLYGLSGT